MPRILPSDERSIAAVAERLRAGEVVAFPTETVYGLGADTFNRVALERVYELKGRPANNPLIAHVLDAAQARTLVSQWDSRCDALAARFWPGPLTLVLPKKDSVPDQTTAGLSTIAVRAPAHPAARRLLALLGSPISAPSANRSGHVSPTTAEHVAGDFSHIDDLLILDGGPSDVGIESTVLDLAGPSPRILRPGSVTVEQLQQVLGKVESRPVTTQAASPGTSAAHYAPRTPAELVEPSKLQARIAQFSKPVVVLSPTLTKVAAPHYLITMPKSAHEYAHHLYTALRQADALGCSAILMETPQGSDDLWRSILDRLRRAGHAQT